MHVLFVEPAFPRNQRQFVRGLRTAGARVTGIGERPLAEIDPELSHWLYRYERVSSVCDERALLHAVRRCQAREAVDRLEATVEAHILPAARVREACSIPGTSVETAFLCRDKPTMKQALREAGIPCAESTAASSAEEARAFAARVGFPIFLKPRDAAGSAGTCRVDSFRDLDQVLALERFDRGASIAVEEFVEGHEGFFDTLSVDGEVVHEFVSHYYPNVLEAMRTRWISPQFITTNRLDSPGYAELRALGRKVIARLGIGTSATHMEWFFGPKGLRFSEIGCRPPGVLTWDLYCAANEMDVYAEWATLLVRGRPSQTPSRRYSAGLIALRPDRDGAIAGYSGLEEAERALGEWVIDSHFPPPGTPTQGVEAGYMANAWIRVRHPDYDRLGSMLDSVGRTVKVHAA